MSRRTCQTCQGLATGLLLGLAHTMASAMAPAQWTITYTPASGISPTAVPALGDSGLILLALALAAGAAWFARRKAGRGTVAGLVLAAAFGGALMGPEIIRPAQAGMGYSVMDQAGGGTVAAFSYNLNDGWEIRNTTGVAQQVTSVSVSLGVPGTPISGSPRCTVGLVVPPGGSCYVALAVG